MEEGPKVWFNVNPASWGRPKADGGSPVESRSITPQGGEAVALPFGRTRGFKPHVRYNLIHPDLSGIKKGQEASQAVVIENARAYVRLLREHIQKEDETLFHMADEVLTQGDQELLLRQFEEREAKEIDTGVYEKYLKIAEELENDNGWL